MENREVASSSQITKDIIGNFLLWELIFQFCYTIIFRLIIKNIDSNGLTICIAIVLQFIVAIFVWKITLIKTFKKKVIRYKDVSAIMKNLLIFIIVICLIMIIYNFSNINSAINESIDESKELQFLDSFVNSMNSENITSIYKEQKQEAIETVKDEVYQYMIIFDISYVLINLIVLPYERKHLLSYVAMEDNINK